MFAEGEQGRRCQIERRGADAPGQKRRYAVELLKSEAASLRGRLDAAERVDEHSGFRELRVVGLAKPGNCIGASAAQGN